MHNDLLRDYICVKQTKSSAQTDYGLDMFVCTNEETREPNYIIFYQIFLLTDGRVRNTDEVIKLAKKNNGNTRLVRPYKVNSLVVFL